MENNEIVLSNDINFSINKEHDGSIFIVKKDSHVNIEVTDNFENLNLTFFVQEDASVKLNFVNLSGQKSLNLKGNVCRNGIFLIYFADFSKANFDINSNIVLYDDNAKSEFKFASLVSENFQKNYNISFSHIGLNTESLLEGYGVSKDKGNLQIKGVSHIEKGSIKSKANQIAKVILFDNESKASASPILKIDCDDIKANHGCAIGALNENHLYYLLSRGLTINEAKKLITAGYLHPISNFFNDLDKEIIEKKIEENF